MTEARPIGATSDGARAVWVVEVNNAVRDRSLIFEIVDVLDRWVALPGCSGETPALAIEAYNCQHRLRWWQRLNRWSHILNDWLLEAGDYEGAKKNKWVRVVRYTPEASE
jgi:hypothetical protein